MIRKIFICTALAALAAIPASAQSLDEVLAHYVKARGGAAKLASVNTVRITAKASGGGGPELPLLIEQKRPNKSRVEFTFQGLTGVQVFDGKIGWAINPFQGKKDAELMGEDQLKAAKDDADFDGWLVNPESKGVKVELLGKESVEGTDAYKLKLTLPTGTEMVVYLDSEEFLEIKNESKRTVRGAERESETILGDYKEVEGLTIPFSIENGRKGGPPAERQKLTIEKVEFNVPINDSRFEMPPPTAPPAESTPKAEQPKN
jgi:outer membrane lipoprotein-sorting protein